MRANSPLVGTPAEIVDRIAAFREAGVQRVYLQLLDLSDLDHLELFATAVVPRVTTAAVPRVTTAAVPRVTEVQ